MAENFNTQPRALAPRKLEQRENLQSLNQWKCVLTNFYRRCPFYGYFLTPGMTWSSGVNRDFTLSEQTGLKRTPEVLASDLDGFLSTIASYLPFDYIAENLSSQSTNMQTVWSIIYELYDAEISTSHYLDYATMTKFPEETYRNFHNICLWKL